jgi:hypothetical protein
VGSVVIDSGSVLSVRFLDDRHCDSLDVLVGLFEEGGPCGGHLIGRVYSELPRQIDANHPTDNIADLGLTIQGGTNPSPGRVRVMRTSGYAPPNSGGLQAAVLRYYNVAPEFGPQRGALNHVTFRLHCDELNGARLSELRFWRTRNRGDAWRFSGSTSFDADSLTFSWDTTSLGYPNGSNGFYWTLAEGFEDVPLPVELLSFAARSERGGVQLEWQTASETRLRGYELERTQNGQTAVVASFEDVPVLLSKSRYGALYRFNDSGAEPGSIEYRLYEVNQDGIRSLLASRRIEYSSNPPLSILLEGDQGSRTIAVHGGTAGMVTMELVDLLGRPILHGEGTSPFRLSLPRNLSRGLYLIQVKQDGVSSMGKILQDN